MVNGERRNNDTIVRGLFRGCLGLLGLCAWRARPASRGWGSFRSTTTPVLFDFAIQVAPRSGPSGAEPGSRKRTADAPTTETEDAKKRKGGKPDGKLEGKPDSKGGKPDGKLEGKKDPKQVKKQEQDKMLANIGNIKKRCKTALQDATDLIGSVRTQPDWEWANNSFNLNALVGAKTSVETVKTSSEFLKAWVVQDQFAAYAHKHFSEDELNAGIKRVEALLESIIKVEEETAKIKRMHAARSSK